MSVGIVGVVHELGHALAAAIEHIRIRSCGVSLMLMYPAMQVDIDDEWLKLPSIKVLRIACMCCHVVVVMVQVPAYGTT